MSSEPTAKENPGNWYGDWQNRKHASNFDARSRLDAANLFRDYESFNDVLLLNERLDPSRKYSLLEVGCATGEFYRYLRLKHPDVVYRGFDISAPAIELAKAKYAQGDFWITDPSLPLSAQGGKIGMIQAPDIIYSKDVVIHHTDPFGFISQLLEYASHMLVMRLRTRDQGPSELNPDLSCQYHYSGWMPYMVLNLDEVIRLIQKHSPRAEVVVFRNHMVLGGQNARFLPKDCFLPATGTSETAIGVFKETTRPGEVAVLDRADARPRYNLKHRLTRLIQKVLNRP